MTSSFGDRLWIVRKRVLAFAGVFFMAGTTVFLLGYLVSDAKADPGPVVYLFAPAIAFVLGTFPTLTYFLNRWIKQFEVTHCPTCGAFIWPTTIEAVQVAMLPRCPKCMKKLGDAAGEG